MDRFARPAGNHEGLGPPRKGCGPKNAAGTVSREVAHLKDVGAGEAVEFPESPSPAISASHRVGTQGQELIAALAGEVANQHALGWYFRTAQVEKPCHLGRLRQATSK